jgi:CheY-like chemotaxis protein/HPt (histidine-containing phosphotransfer) domain-containing protein
LLLNEFSFSLTAMEVTLQIESLQQSSSYLILVFNVIDSGIGLSAEQQEKIFEAFMQADNSSTRKFGGSGLGLAISKRLTALMGGSLTIDSTLGQGSCFKLTVPFIIDEGVAPLLRLPPQQRALIIDSHATFRAHTQYLLQEHGWQVDTKKVFNPQDSGLTQYDWIFVDQNLATDSLPLADFSGKLVLLSRHFDPPPHKRCDFFRFLCKPLTPGALRKLYSEEAPLDVTHCLMQNLSLQDKHVLLVEDNALNLEVAEKLLQGFGIKISTAMTGYECLQMLKQYSFDLILMDLQMPGIDGYETTRRIREQAAYATLPIIAMTATALPGDRETCLQAGMNDHLPKPVDPRRLYNVLHHWLHADLAKTREWQPLTHSLALETPAQNLKVSLNTQMSLNRFNGDMDFYKHLLNKFCQGHTNDVDDIRCVLKQNDYRSATRIAHTLKSSAGNIGAEALRHYAAQLEHSLKQKHIDDNLMKHTQSEINSVCQVIQVFINVEDKALT